MRHGYTVLTATSGQDVVIAYVLKLLETIPVRNGNKCESN